MLIAEIMSVDMNPFRHMILVNRGGRDGVAVGQPVIDADGVVGQITRDRHYSAEAMLVTDVDHAVPVEIARNRLRTIAVHRRAGVAHAARRRGGHAARSVARATGGLRPVAGGARRSGVSVGCRRPDRRGGSCREHLTARSVSLSLRWARRSAQVSGSGRPPAETCPLRRAGRDAQRKCWGGGRTRPGGRPTTGDCLTGCHDRYLPDALGIRTASNATTTSP